MVFAIFSKNSNSNPYFLLFRLPEGPNGNSRLCFLPSCNRARNTTVAGDRDVVRAEGVEDGGVAYAEEFREGLNADPHARIL